MRLKNLGKGLPNDLMLCIPLHISQNDVQHSPALFSGGIIFHKDKRGKVASSSASFSNIHPLRFKGTMC